MRKIIGFIIILAVVTLGGIAIADKNSRAEVAVEPAVSVPPAGSQLNKATLSIEGMWCSSCATGAEYSLKELEGVSDAYVALVDDLDGEGWVIYEKGKVSDEQIIKAIEPYKATIISDIPYAE